MGSRKLIVLRFYFTVDVMKTFGNFSIIRAVPSYLAKSYFEAEVVRGNSGLANEETKIRLRQLRHFPWLV